MKATRAALLTLLLCPLRLNAQAPPFETGLEFLDPGQYAGIPLAAPMFAGPLPPRVDLTSFAPVGNQGRQGSCVGWATAFALKTYQEEVERHWGTSTPSHQFSPSYVYNQVHRGPNCKGGITFVAALDLLTREGVATLDDFSYDENKCSILPSAAVKQRAASYRIASWRRVNVLDRTEVKTHLADGFPVLVGMPVDREFMDLRGTTVYQGLTSASLGGHAMVVTGYDDAIGAFRLLNSWGDRWGDGGQAWISYGGFQSTVREGYVVQDIIAAAPAAALPTIEFETIVLADAPTGIRTTTRTTADHHCSRDCAGEPTRTNYTLTLDADPGATLRNPKLVCINGPCEGWNSINYVRIENAGTRAIASWDVWAHPTTWELSAEQMREVETSRFTRVVEVGTPFTILGQTGAPPPRVEGRFATGEHFTFTAGQPTLNPRLRLTGVEVQGPETIYHYESH